MERLEKKPILSSAIRAMLNTQSVNKEEKSEAKDKKEMVSIPKPESKKMQNSKAYARYRGKAEDGITLTKPMSYYLTENLIKALELRKSRGISGERDRSSIVRNALELYLQDELKLIKKG